MYIKLSNFFILSVLLISMAGCCASSSESKTKDCEALVNTFYPGYRRVILEDMEKTYFNKYLKDEKIEKPGYVEGDFDGDGTIDCALLIVKKQSQNIIDEKLVVFLFEKDKPVKSQVLESFEQFYNELFIKPALPGKFHQWDNESNGMDVTKLGIELRFYEKSAKIFYWYDGKFGQIQTED